MTPEHASHVDEAVLHRHLQQLVVLGLVGSTLIQASAIACIWGAWPRVLVVSACWLSMGAINWAITAFAFPKVGSERAEDLRLVPNVVLTSIAGHATAWCVPSLLFLPFAAVLVGGLQTERPTLRLAFMVGTIGGYALADGGPPVLVAAFSGLALFWHYVGQAHTALARQMLAERERNLADLARALENLRVAQQSALASEKLAGIGLLAAGVAHEINNPMCFVTTNVAGLLEDLRAAGELSPQLAEYRDDILPDTLAGIRRVNGIVADLRRFAHGEPEPPSVFDLAREVESAIRISRTQLKAGQTLRVEADGSFEVFGQCNQIGRVVLTLIVNAIEASADGGTIVVSIGSTPQGARLAIRDDGTGMSAEVLANLFLPFFTTKGIGHGAGAGLAVAHGIVQAHGGRIEVSSEVGHGTRFEVFLPAPAAGNEGA